MSTNFSKRLGYGGSAVIDGTQVLVSGGSFETQKTPSFMDAYDIDPSQNSRSRILHADGTEVYTGSINLDITDAFLSLCTTAKLFGRRYIFNIGIDDGNGAWVMNNCLVSTLSMQGAERGILTASLSVMSAGVKETGTISNDYIGFQGTTGFTNNSPIGYWYSGNSFVRDWSLSMTQEVIPVFTNTSSVAPTYLKCGQVTYSMQVSTYQPLTGGDVGGYHVLNISTKTFTIKVDTGGAGISTLEGYNVNGQQEFGIYTYSFESAAQGTTADVAHGLQGSNQNVITIS